MSELILGQSVATPSAYAPHLLHPIPRAPARARLGFGTVLPFGGEDVWHAYELSWLDPDGVPVCFLGRCVVPCSSSHLIESKSFKLYLNSLNNLRLAPEAARALIQADLSAVANAPVTLELLPLATTALGPAVLPGESIDGARPLVAVAAPDAALLALMPDAGVVTEVLYSELMRSLCPVTAAPDWATVIIAYTGPRIDRAALLSYITAFRSHAEFHEQCVERLFIDVWRQCQPAQLSVQAHYTRRGGLDINPFRSTSPQCAPRRRLPRQ